MKTAIYKIITFLMFFSVNIIYSQWSQIGEDINAESSGDAFGYRVCINSDGSVIAVGAPRNDGNGARSGHVRVFFESEGIWMQVGQDIDGEANEDFSGSSVSINSDGSIIAIGAHENNGNGSKSGHVRIYRNIEGIWNQVGQDIDGEDMFDFFGYSVSLNANGLVLAVGAPKNGGNGLSSGHVRIYKNIEDVWTQIGNDIDGESENDESGESVSISDDGSIVAIGAPNNSEVGSVTGHVRVYRNSDDVWTQIGNDIDGINDLDNSGYSISLSSNGLILAIGSIFGINTSGLRTGQVRIFEFTDNNWMQIGQSIFGEEQGDRFGESVSLNSDGTVLSIGASYNDDNGVHSGQVSVFKYIDNSWIQLGLAINGEAADDQSGTSVSINSDGSKLVIGAPFNSGSFSYSGHVRVFENDALKVNDYMKSNLIVYPNPIKSVGSTTNVVGKGLILHEKKVLRF